MIYVGTRYCPKCESENIKYAGIVDGNFDIIGRCLDCGHRWSQIWDQYLKEDSSKQKENDLKDGGKEA